MTPQDTFGWDFDGALHVDSEILCPKCKNWSALAGWREGSVQCEDCGDHATMQCPTCDSSFDHVHGPLFQVRRPMTKEERYFGLCHAMQAGVAAEMHFNPAPALPKHLLVGVNTALCDHGALVNLLVRKGLITREEYVDAITENMQREVDGYEERLTKSTGAPVKLI